MNNATVVDEIADGIFRIATHLDGLGATAGIDVCQFVVVAEEPLIVHTGMRTMFGDVAPAICRVLPVEQLRWLSFSHLEGDECGAMNLLLDVAPHAQVAFGVLGCVATLDDHARRRPVRLDDGETLDLGGRRLRCIATPHIPHNSEAQLLFEEVTGTLFCSDLLAQPGRCEAVTDDLSIVERAVAEPVALASMPPGPAASDTMRRLAALAPTTLAVMHGSSFAGDGATALQVLADRHEAGQFVR